MEFVIALKQISGAFLRQANRMLERHGLTASQSEALFFLIHREKGSPPAIQRDIEAALHLSNPTVSGTLDRLEKKGLIERHAAPGNRRVNQIVVTDAARALHAGARREMEALQERMLSCLSGEERVVLNALLNRILTGIREL